MGIDAVKGLIPGVNFIEWCKAVGRPTWHVALLLFPIVNFFIFAGMCIDLVRSFKKYKFSHSAGAVIYPPAMFAWIARDEKASYVGPSLTMEKDYRQQLLEAKESGNERKYKRLLETNPYKKSGGREWVESIIFAVFAAAFIRMFLIEAYVIPTPSMEGSLNVGDYLFVSKAHYGIRTPMTVAMIPLLHNRIPFFNTESYLKKPSLPYKRLPAIEDIDRNDPIVFNWPVGDSVYVTRMRPYSVEQVMRDRHHSAGDRELAAKMRKKDYHVRPIDKKDHYIKRCVAVAGDSLQIKNRQIFINGQEAKNPEHMQFLYKVSGSLNRNQLEDWGIDDADRINLGNGVNAYYLDLGQAEKLKSLGGGVSVEFYPQGNKPGKVFPHNAKLFPGWTIDNYGPIWIPKAGETIQLNQKNIALYRRAIHVYEGNDVVQKGGKLIINGEAATEYTFKQDYFWAMGDNRHNSEDSRAWGFVPHDHIVGKPLFIWFSTKDGNIFKGINWDRLFTSASKH